MTPDTTTLERLEGLRARVEAATDGLDDETLGRLLCAVHGVPFGSVDICCGDDGSDEFNVYPAGRHTFQFGGYRHRMPDRSLDAALALVERVLPGWEWSIVGPGLGMRPFVRLFSHPHGEEQPEADGATQPLAIISALLSALIEKEKASS